MIPHYISEDIFPFLSATSSVTTLDQGSSLFSDRGTNRFGEIIISPNAKSALWFNSDGDLQIYKVKNPDEFITADPNINVTGFNVVLVPPDKRFLVWSLFERIPQAKQDLKVNAAAGTFSTLTVQNNGLEINTSTGKKAKIAEWIAGTDLTKIQITDDGNVQAVRNNKVIFSLLPTEQPKDQPAGSGLNITSLLLPGLALAALIYLKK